MSPTLPPELYDLVIDQVDPLDTLTSCALVCRQWCGRAQFRLFSSISIPVPTGKDNTQKDPSDNLRSVLSTHPALSLPTSTLALSLESDDRSTYDKDIVEDWTVRFPNLRQIIFVASSTMPSLLPLPLLVSTLRRLPRLSFNTLTLRGVDVTSTCGAARAVNVPQNVEDCQLPCILHLAADFHHTSYLRGTPSVGRMNACALLDELIRHRLLSRESLITLDLPQYWTLSTIKWDAFDGNFPSLQHFSVLLSHSQSLDSLHDDDGTHENTRRLLDALTGCPNLRSLHIIYGEPERRRDWHTVRDSALASPALVDILTAHFARARAPHPRLEELRLTLAYDGEDVEDVWGHARTLPRLAATLADGARYPAFRRVRVRSLVPASLEYRAFARALETPREACARLFEVFAEHGVEVEVEAGYMWGDDGIPDEVYEDMCDIWY
ncbi:uncharacterized protein BXZ73DRAFT_105436 [Epithele typhae]|uniref:uncharacterized protein n=1 Tax=Epithele typhae TaxID=378194 RepID=UPI002007F8F8|nr:uncharacterized protein BXZ73DRAFT_105436 [Epithele typhae]KAH9917916.1 hypothetical protein BXZ73DRAFT_105436 [Epithele typhae]